MTARLSRVLVIGTGLIGTSIGLALRARGVDVVLEDADAGVLAASVERGAGHLAQAATGIDLGVVAVPPSVTAGLVATTLERDEVAFVTDVASVKAPVAAALAAEANDSAVPQLARYVGGHPMAGREVSGPAGAREDLFLGRPWVITPGPDTAAEAVEALTELAVLVGATPVTMTAEQHDAAVALVSHTPHLMAVLAAARLAGGSDREVRLAGPGVSDVTRVAGSDPQMWVEILLANTDAVRDVLGGVRDDLDRALAALVAKDADGLADLLSAGVAGRSRLPGKHGRVHEDFVSVPVLVSDRPGQLARLFADVGAAGVNVEDLRIDHVPGEPVGVVALEVKVSQRDGLVTTLEHLGWTVQA